MVVNYDNYKCCLINNYAAKWSNFLHFCLPFFFPLSFPLNLSTYHNCSHQRHKIGHSFHKWHFMLKLLVLAYYKRKPSNQEVWLYSHTLLLFFKGFSFFACGLIVHNDPSSVQHRRSSLLVAFPYLSTPSLLPVLWIMVEVQPVDPRCEIIPAEGKL
jgi:hypothetical protein